MNLLSTTKVTFALAALIATIASAAMVTADAQSRVLAANTLLLASSVAVASTLVGAPLAFLLARTDIVGRRALGVALVALLFTPLYLQAAAWQAGFGLSGWWTV